MKKIPQAHTWYLTSQSLLMARIQTSKDTSRKEVIVQAAAALFLEKGYKAASMRDLAEKVGVEAASLYNHIRSKTDLLHDICFVVANRYWEEIGRIESEDISSIQKIEALLRFLINQMLFHFVRLNSELLITFNKLRLSNFN